MAGTTTTTADPTAGRSATERRLLDMVAAHNAGAGPRATRIGVLTPLSPPGDPVAGELAIRGALLGAELARSQGRDVRLFVENDQRTAHVEHMSRSAVGGLAKLAFVDRVAAVVGQWHLRTAPAVADACEELGLPVFVENGHNTVTDGRRFVYRTYFSIADRAPLIVGFVREQGWRRVAIVATDTVFGRMMADTMAEALGAVPGTEVFRRDFPQDDVDDLRPELREVADFGPDLLLNVGVVRTNYMIIEAAAEAGLLPGVAQIVSYPFPMRSEDYWRLAGDAGEGVLWAATRFGPSWEGLAPVGRWFVDAYRERFGGAPPDNALNAFTDVTILAEAAALAGAEDRQAINAALLEGTFATWRGDVSFRDGPHGGHHQPPEIVLMHYARVGAAAEEAVVVWPPEASTATYAPPRRTERATGAS